MVLVHTGKYQSTMWDISTPERRAAAYLACFRALDNDDCYVDLADEPSEPSITCEACVKGLHRLCEAQATCMCADESCRLKRATKAQAVNLALRKTRRQREWLALARSGDPEAAERLLMARRGYEHEGVREDDVLDPLEA